MSDEPRSKAGTPAVSTPGPAPVPSPKPPPSEHNAADMSLPSEDFPPVLAGMSCKSSLKSFYLFSLHTFLDFLSSLCPPPPKKEVGGHIAITFSLCRSNLSTYYYYIRDLLQLPVIFTAQTLFN